MYILCEKKLSYNGGEWSPKEFWECCQNVVVL